MRNLILSESNLDSGGGHFSRPIAEAKEQDYVTGRHAETIAAAYQSGNADWATTMSACDPRAIYWAARSLVEGGKEDWRRLFYDHPSQSSYIFGENSLPDPDFDQLPKAGVRTFVVPGAGHSMGIENPAGLAECIAAACSTGDQAN